MYSYRYYFQKYFSKSILPTCYVRLRNFLIIFTIGFRTPPNEIYRLPRESVENHANLARCDARQTRTRQSVSIVVFTIRIIHANIKLEYFSQFRTISVTSPRTPLTCELPSSSLDLYHPTTHESRILSVCPLWSWFQAQSEGKKKYNNKNKTTTRLLRSYNFGLTFAWITIKEGKILRFMRGKKFRRPDFAHIIPHTM